MAGVREKVTQLFNRIFRRNSNPMIANIAKQNYDEYRKTYDTLLKVFGKLDGIDVYLVGGISAAIQTNQDLYRQNNDIDIICKEEDLSKLIEILPQIGYSVDDRRGTKTRNRVSLDGHFQATDHELNANARNRNMLNIGIFTYQVKGNKVITYSYAFEEKEGKTIGTEKVIPKELFDLMYDGRTVDYKGIKLKTQSKEYIYMTKSRGTREKDKLDTSVIEPTLDDKSKAKITRIKELETKVRTYRLLYGKGEEVKSRIKLPTQEEKVNAYLDTLFMKDITKTPEEIIADVLQSEEYHKIIGSHPEIDSLIEAWRENAKHYTYQDRIELLTKNYSTYLDGFSKESIDNALAFLQRRRINHGKNDNDIELCVEAKEIFKLMQEYGQSIKKVFVANNIDITHITGVAPEDLEGGELVKSLDRANNYETERVDGVFASSSKINGNNPYIARNSSGMILLDKSTYIYGSDNIKVTQDSDEKMHAVLKQPNYIYYINPIGFTPVCNLAMNPNTHQLAFEFSEEWISDTVINISDPNQVRGIEIVEDVTSLLYNYTILCDVQSQGIGLKVRQLKSKEEGLRYIIEKINDGSIRNVNQEAGINDRTLSDNEIVN